MTTNTIPSTASQAPAVTIDTPEFRQRLRSLRNITMQETMDIELNEICDDINAKLEQTRAEGFEEMRQAMAESAKIMADACRRATAAEAKLEAIRQGVDVLRWCYKSGEPRGEREAVWRDEVLALFTTPPKADESGLPG